MKHRVGEWISNCVQGIVGALVVTIVLYLVQVIGPHIDMLLQHVAQCVGGVAMIRVTRV